MNKFQFGTGVLAVALLAPLGWLIPQARSVHFDANNTIVSAVRELKQIDAERNVDVLRSRTGLNNNYDPLASPLPLIRSLESGLSLETKSFWGDLPESSAQLLPLLAAYEKAVARKSALIERFKSQNAILRNSSRFLLVAATDLIDAIRSKGSAIANRAQVESSLNTLLTDTMTYNQAPELALRNKISTGLGELQQMVQGLPADVRGRANTMAAHIATILKQEAIGAGVLGELATVPTASALDAFSVAHAAEHEALLLTQQRSSQVLIAYSALLMLLFSGFIAWRLIGKYRATNAALAKLHSELKESQVYMVQTEKMSALGQMVAGVAHEINTPLAYVRGTFGVIADNLTPVKELAQRCQLFTEALRSPSRDKSELNLQLRNLETISEQILEQGTIEEMRGLMDEGVHGIDQISEIVVNLKNFSRLDRARISDFSVQDGLKSTLLLARNLLGDIEVKQEFDSSVPSIRCSPSQINQVFLNIMSNAAHAMASRDHGGVITLRTRAEKGEQVRIEIEDNGSGIPKEVLPQIFDPFFTTKEIGEGSGMGLSISYKIIEQHGGKILVESKEGAGTKFSIVLPVRAAEQTRAKPERQLLAA
ncbi:MAG: DAHL domain-containing protein [Burkholderiales bacterium]